MKIEGGERIHDAARRYQRQAVDSFVDWLRLKLNITGITLDELVDLYWAEEEVKEKREHEISLRR